MASPHLTPPDSAKYAITQHKSTSSFLHFAAVDDSISTCTYSGVDTNALKRALRNWSTNLLCNVVHKLSVMAEENVSAQLHCCSSTCTLLYCRSSCSTHDDSTRRTGCSSIKSVASWFGIFRDLATLVKVCVGSNLGTKNHQHLWDNKPMEFRLCQQLAMARSAQVMVPPQSDVPECQFQVHFELGCKQVDQLVA